MSQKTENRNTPYIVYFIIAVVAVCLSYNLNKTLFFVVLIIILLWLFGIASNETRKAEIQKQNERKTRRIKQLTEKFGEEFALPIYNKEIRIGMTKEMVIAALGNPQGSKQTLAERYTKERCTWILKDETNTGKSKRKYGVFKNDILIEYGDR